jgi:hypothetical protein
VADAEPTAPLPSPLARAVALGSILFAGLCGGLIGYAFTDLQCEGNCTVMTGVGALVGAVLSAAGVAVIAVLALRAMAEWDQTHPRGASGAGRPGARPG